MHKQRQFITKDFSGVKAGERKEFDLGFTVASNEEIKKELGVADINSLPAGFVAGWASTTTKDHAWHIVSPGAFKESIERKGLEGPKGIKLLAQHRSDKPAGKITKLEYRGDNLWIEAQLNLNVSYVKDLYEVAKDNGGLSFSVGFYLEEWKETNDALIIEKGELFEVSVVTFPCNEDAGMSFIKGITDVATFSTFAEFEKALAASGLVDSRSAAARITQVVKRNPQLWSAHAHPPVEEQPPKALEDISKSLADLKKVFAKS